MSNNKVDAEVVSPGDEDNSWAVADEGNSEVIAAQASLAAPVLPRTSLASQSPGAEQRQRTTAPVLLSQTSPQSPSPHLISSSKKECNLIDIPENAQLDLIKLSTDDIVCINIQPTFPTVPSVVAAILKCRSLQTLRLDIQNSGRSIINRTIVDLPNLTSLVWFGRARHDKALMGWKPGDIPPRFTGGTPWAATLKAIVQRSTRLERLHVSQLNPTCNDDGYRLEEIIGVIKSMPKPITLKSLHLEGWDGDTGTFANLSMKRYGTELASAAPSLAKLFIEIPAEESGTIAEVFSCFRKLKILWIKWSRATTAGQHDAPVLLEAIKKLAINCGKLSIVRLQTYLPNTEHAGNTHPENTFYRIADDRTVTVEPLTKEAEADRRWIMEEPFFIDAQDMMHVPTFTQSNLTDQERNESITQRLAVHPDKNFIRCVKIFPTLPIELEQFVFSLAGPLTQYRCRRMDIDQTESLAVDVKRQIWRDALSVSDRRLDDLPGDPHRILTAEDWCAVTDRDYFKFLVNHLELENFLESSVECDTWQDGGESLLERHLPFHPVLNVPLYRDWPDVIAASETWFRTPVWRVGISAMLGYTEYVRRVLSDPGESARIRRSAMIKKLRDLVFLISGDVEMASLSEVAGYRGHLDVVKAIIDADPGSVQRTMAFGALGGHLNIVKWCHENHSEESDRACGTSTMDWAAKSGALDVVDFLCVNRLMDGCTSDAIDEAALAGHLDIIKRLHGVSASCTKGAMDNAATFGHLDVLKFLHENRSEGCTQWAMSRAAARGRLEVVRFLSLNRPECDTRKTLRYIKGPRCHKEVVAWLRDHSADGPMIKTEPDFAWINSC